MKTPVCSVSINQGYPKPYIAFYRLSRKGDGTGYRFYRLTTDHLIRLLRAMITIATQSPTSILTIEGWTCWSIKDRMAEVDRRYEERRAG